MSSRWPAVLTVLAALIAAVLVFTQPQPLTGVSDDEHNSDEGSCVSGCDILLETCCAENATANDSL